MAQVATCTFAEARAMVVERLLSGRRLSKETIALKDASGRVLAEPVLADRDYPPLARSIRDGFALRASDLPGTLEIIGEVAAGATFDGRVEAGQCVEIMTGAPVPEGADAVVMVEHTHVDGTRMTTERTPRPGEFINPRASEAKRGQEMVQAARRLDYPRIAMAATVGMQELEVFRRPRVAVLSTGDEVVPLEQTPEANQVRNSNAWSLAVQVERAGGVPDILEVARDNYESTRGLVERGLQYDLLLLSGGVSAGKYDIVERVLGDCGAEFYFDRVLIQPGQPLVFGRAQGTFFFGLPGNPASTMVTFELFGRAAVELLAGQCESLLPLPSARLTREFRHKTGLTRFLPAQLSTDGAQVTPMPWQGSSDVPALSRANAFLVAASDREHYSAGDWIQILLR
ncbi:MAG: molybdopterin molybdotransferase MoeA [Acidimicrobiia bacterium]|nr:molybdopterin molybdotransferase MoeA [Acidimicrobiia bacterium]